MTAPQSNQRGIETEEFNQIFLPAGGGLNRTSVGLKHRSLPSLFMMATWASIEPAWD